MLKPICNLSAADGTWLEEIATSCRTLSWANHPQSSSMDEAC